MPMSMAVALGRGAAPFSMTGSQAGLRHGGVGLTSETGNLTRKKERSPLSSVE